MRRLIINGKITIFKTLALSKAVYLPVLTVVSNHIIDQLVKVQSNFIWKNTLTKIKHKTLILSHKQFGLKFTNVSFKIISLQCSLLKRLFDNHFHESKAMPLFCIKMTFSNNFKFHFEFRLQIKK